MFILAEQDSKELSPRPLENAPKTFNSKKTPLFKLFLMLIKDPLPGAKAVFIRLHNRVDAQEVNASQ